MPTSSTLPACSVLLLAGGRGQRMGGQDKGLLQWRGRPLIAHLHGLARPLSDDLIISCNRNQALYAPWCDSIVEDDSQDFPGPLAGIRAGLKEARHGSLLVLACDAPNLGSALLEQMRQMAACNPGKPLMLRQGEHWEPLPCIIPVEHADVFERAWAAGERSPRKVMLQLGAVALQCPDDDPRLANLNTPELLQARTR